MTALIQAIILYYSLLLNLNQFFYLWFKHISVNIFTENNFFVLLAFVKKTAILFHYLVSFINFNLSQRIPWISIK